MTRSIRRFVTPAVLIIAVFLTFFPRPARGQEIELQTALSHLSAAKTDAAKLPWLVRIGDLYVKEKDYADGSGYLEKAYALLHGKSDYETSRYVLSRLCAAELALGDAAKEARYSAALLNLAKKRGDVNTQVEGLDGLIQADALSKDTKRFFSDLTRLFETLYLSGRYSELLTYVSVVDTKLKGQETDGLRGWFSVWYGAAYQAMGDYRSAIGYFSTDYDLSKKDNNVPGMLGALTLLGGADLDMEHLDEAEASLRQGVELAKKVNDDALLATNLGNLGEVLTLDHKLKEAEEMLKQALDLAAKSVDPDLRMGILLNLGKVYYELGEYEKISTEITPEAARLVRNLSRNLHDRVYYYTLMGIYAEKRGKLSDALNDYNEAIAIQRDISASQNAAIGVQDSALQASSLDWYSDLYKYASRVLARLYARSHDKILLERIFHDSEEGKASAFLFSLQRLKEIDLAGPGDAARIDDQIGELQARLMENNIPPGEEARIKEELRRKERERQVMGNLKIFEGNTAGMNRAGLREIQHDLLDSGTVILDFLLVKPVTLSEKETSTCLIVGKKRVEVALIPDSRRLYLDVARYLMGLRTPFQSPAQEAEQLALGEKLYNRLVAGPLKDFRGVSKLIIVPDRILAYLPFECLVSNAKKPRYLVQDFTVSYAPSASALLALERRTIRQPDRRKPLLAFGDADYSPGEKSGMTDPRLSFYEHARGSLLLPLPHTKTEILGIGKLFGLGPDSPDINLGRNASEARLLSMDLSGYRILHFATHGLLPEDLRWLTQPAIILSLENNGKYDGILTLDKIYNLHLNADLVVLSACDTGLGKEVNGEGVIGMNRAFLVAGARSVVSSLWEVDDASTSILMERFYRFLKSGESKAGALRKAKLALLATKKFRNPFYWGAFVLTGDRGPVFPSRRSSLSHHPSTAGLSGPSARSFKHARDASSSKSFSR